MPRIAGSPPEEKGRRLGEEVAHEHLTGVIEDAQTHDPGLQLGAAVELMSRPFYAWYRRSTHPDAAMRIIKTANL